MQFKLAIVFVAVSMLLATSVGAQRTTPSKKGKPTRTKMVRTTKRATSKKAKAKKAKGQIEKFDDAQRILVKELTAQKGYEQNDLVTQKPVKEAFKKIEQAGWKIKDAKEILSLVTGEGDLLARELGTSKGVKFMRKLNRHKAFYDRLERFSEIPQGRQSVHDMIHKLPDGEKLMEGILATKRGQRLTSRLAKSKGGANFGKPTGKIYTETALLKRLQESFKKRKTAK